MTAPKIDSTAAVKAILEARRHAAIEVQAIPAAPQPAAKAPSLSAQSLTQPAAVPTVETAPTPTVSDEDVEAFLRTHLPGLVRAAVDLATPPFKFGEVVDFGAAVSAAVAAGLPQVRGLEARALVVIITRYVWREFATPALPAHVRPLAGFLESMIITGIEAAYRLLVKPAKR